MSTGEPSVLRIPNFVKARSPKRLRELVLEVQARLGLQFDFTTLKFVYNPDDKNWYCWYPELVELDMIKGEIIEDGN